jgi:hypothetical protein
MSRFRIFTPRCPVSTELNCQEICNQELQVIEQMTTFFEQPRLEGCTNVGLNAPLRKSLNQQLPQQNTNGDENIPSKIGSFSLRKSLNQQLPQQNTNGDENIPSKIGSFSKGLPHNSIGEVDLAAYQTLTDAVSLSAEDSGQSYTTFDKIKTSGVLSGPSGYFKLANPQSALSFDLEGYDSHMMAPPAAPSVYSQEAMDELLENYWMSLTRDISFSEYETNTTTQAAAADLTTKTEFYGPRIDGVVTPKTLFKAPFEGSLVGPYISQFLYLDCPYGSAKIDQKIKTYLPNTNFVKDYTTFLNIQNGKVPTEIVQMDPVLRYIRNGRDLSVWVHLDVTYGAFFNALNILMTKSSAESQFAGIGCPVVADNPYLSPNSSSINQGGFVTFGNAHISTLLAEVAQRALKMAWFQKWCVQKRLRPEAMAGLVYNEHNNLAQYGLNTNYLQSTYFTQTNSNYLLEQAYPEAAPLHPSYLAGHSAIAGACVTILKVWFKNDFVIPHPKVPSEDGTALVDYVGPPLTVIGELNKLAGNIGMGRNIAGVHYRSDMLESTLMGEEVAISILRDQKFLYNESFRGWSLTKFDGTHIII